MIVWIASYPRSGNTFFRIVLHRLYGVASHSGAAFRSGDDILRDTGANLTGEAPLPAALAAALAARDESRIEAALEALEHGDVPVFIKTHSAEAPRIGRAVLVVRDGRDAAVSLAWYMLDVSATFSRLARSAKGRPYLTQPGKAFPRMAALLGRVLMARAPRFLGLREKLWRRVLREEVIEPEAMSWSRFHERWLARPAPTVIVRYEDLVADPAACVAQALRSLGLPMEPVGSKAPAFEELKAIHPAFFRAGRSTWREEMPAAELALFHERHGACLEKLGYGGATYNAEIASR